MLKGALSLLIRQLLLIACGALVAAGIIIETGNSHFCFDAKQVAEWGASAIVLLIGGGASGAASFAWRIWAKRRGGVT